MSYWQSKNIVDVYKPFTIMVKNYQRMKGFQLQAVTSNSVAHVVVDSLFIVAPIVLGFCVWSLFCYSVLCVLVLQSS